jgi:hypothetical protein
MSHNTRTMGLGGAISRNTAAHFIPERQTKEAELFFTPQ